MDMKLRDRTTYKDTFAGGREGLPKFMRDHEDIMKKSCFENNTKGSLARHIEVPFMGKSVSHETFINPNGKIRKEICRPVDEVSYL